MKVKEIREKTDNELKNLIRENKEKLKKLRFSLANRQLENTREISEAKITVARAKTVLKEKAQSEIN
ncbi:MAG: 50S ribosomal protein L29 [Candidatus Pacebacteria bacterium]|jgi:large subunit ribosomal protein L29|nr:50S ribosomal protein L29 [Candidatus Paceibacterota bacterium]